MYFTEEELLEAIDILVEEYGYDEEDAIDIIAEAYEIELLDEESNWGDHVKDLSNNYLDGYTTGAKSAAFGAAAGVGLGVTALGVNQLRKDLKNSLKTRKNIKNIRKTGRRLTEDGKLNKTAKYVGIAMGAYGVSRGFDPAIRSIARKTKKGLKNHDERVRARNLKKEQDAIIEYRKNRIKKAIKRR